MAARWREWREEQAAALAERLRILREATGMDAQQETLRRLRETTALPKIRQAERLLFTDLSHTELSVYGDTYKPQDVLPPPDSPLWLGKCNPWSAHRITSDEENNYAPDSTGIPVAANKPTAKPVSSRFVTVKGERLVAEDAKSQALLDFMRPYLELYNDGPDAPDAAVNFHRESRLRENYAQRSELAHEHASTLQEVATDFAKILYLSLTTTDAEKQRALSATADALLMDFNIQRYALFRLLKGSHWKPTAQRIENDQTFLQNLSRHVLVQALAEQSHALPTRHELHSQDFQTPHQLTLETYFNTAYERIAPHLGIRPHRDRIQEVPLVDAAEIDARMFEGRVH